MDSDSRVKDYIAQRKERLTMESVNGDKLEDYLKKYSVKGHANHVVMPFNQPALLNHSYLTKDSAVLLSH